MQSVAATWSDMPRYVDRQEGGDLQYSMDGVDDKVSMDDLRRNDNVDVDSKNYYVIKNRVYLAVV